MWLFSGLYLWMVFLKDLLLQFHDFIFKPLWRPYYRRASTAEIQSSSDDVLAPLPLSPTTAESAPTNFHHRRDLSQQSNSSWGYGPLVLNFGEQFARNHPIYDSHDPSLSSSDNEEDRDLTNYA
jgi:hypothetical protein